MKAYTDITPVHEPWPPGYSKSTTYGQLWRQIATPLSKNAYHVRSMV